MSPSESRASKLGDRFLIGAHSKLERRKLPFFSDLHREISSSWKQPFSSRLTNAAAADFTNLVGSVEQGYTAMPVIEDTLASHLSPSLAPSWKSRPLLPSKPCRTTSALIGKSYIAAGQAGMALHTMAILQAYQADVLKEMDEGTGLTPEAVKELRRATDLALRATKHTTRAVGRSMAASVAAERHLWLNLTEIREKEKVFLMDAPISQSGLFGEAVSTVVDKPFLWWMKELRLHPTVPATRLIRVSRSCCRHLLMWRDPIFLQSGVRMGAIHRRHMITTDASMTGWGAVFEGRPASGEWKEEFLFWHINCLELRAVFLALKYFLPVLGGHHIIVRTDNIVVVSHINRQGGSKSSSPLVPRQVPLFEGGSRSGSTEPGGRFSVETEAQARGMDVEPSDGIPDLGSVWQSGGGPLCFSRVIPVPALVLPEFPDDSGHRFVRPPIAECQSVRI